MSPIISRQFSLIPLKGTRSETINKINIGLTKAKALTNVYIRHLISRILHHELEYDHLKSENKKVVRQLIYDHFDYSKCTSPAFGNYPYSLAERIKQAAFYRALTITRLWLMRIHDLQMISTTLQDLFNDDPTIMIKFLEGKNLGWDSIRSFRKALSTDVFGRKHSMTGYFLNNHLKQLKNLLMECEDSRLKASLKGSISSLLAQPQELKIIIEKWKKRVIETFKKKKKGSYVAVGEENVTKHVLDQFFRKLSAITTEMAKTIISRKIQLYKLEERKQCNSQPHQFEYPQEKQEKLESSLYHGQTRLLSIVPELKSHVSSLMDSNTLKSFKKARKKLFDSKKEFYLDHVSFSVNDIIHETLKENLHELNEMASLKQLLAALFKPRFPKIYVKENNPEEFLLYHGNKDEERHSV